jgi:hypothetical protein
MYDKYNQLLGVTANTTKLPKNKGLFITGITGNTGITFWAYTNNPQNLGGGMTSNVAIGYMSTVGIKQDIIPIETYAVTAINGVCAYILL